MSDEEVAILTRKIDKVINYLHNDEGTGEKGLIAKVNDLKRELTEFKVEYEKNQAVKKAQIGIYGFLGGGILWLAKFLVELFYSK
jgi:hypothetical protein